MRGSFAALACLVLASTACLNQAAQLVGDGGACAWRSAGDAGPCANDTECPSGFYCDFTPTYCLPLSNQQRATVQGTCLLACDTSRGTACHLGEDCSPDDLCFFTTPMSGGTVQTPCTEAQPCNGVCGTFGSSAPPLGCPSSFTVADVPHTPWSACLCPGNTCDAPEPPDAGPDAGLLPDAGPDAGSLPDGVIPYTDAGHYQNLLSGDLNGDGILDLVAGWSGGTSYNGAAFSTVGFDVFYGLADGGLTAPAHYDGGADGLNFAIADLDGDGVADLVASNVFGLSVYLGLADGGLASPAALGVDAGSVFSVGVGDFSGSGHMDVVVATSDGSWSGHLYWFINSGDGTFPSAVEIASQRSINYAPQLKVFDLNGDGYADIVEIDGYASLIILLNEGGDGGFAQTSLALGEFFPSGQPMAFFREAGGRMDLALSTTWLLALADTWQMLVLSNNGDGTFSDGGQFPCGEFGPANLYPGYVASADLDGDGLTDLGLSGTAANLGFSNVQVLYGGDGGGFGAPQIFATRGSYAQGIAALGSVTNPTAFAIADAFGGGITIVGDASKH